MFVLKAASARRASSFGLSVGLARSLAWSGKSLTSGPMAAAPIEAGGSGDGSGAFKVPIPHAAASEGGAAVAVPAVAPLSAGQFYEEYHGHKVEHLEEALAHLRTASPEGSVMFLAGDSSLDNKHWFFDPWHLKADQMYAADFTADAVGAYTSMLTPPRMVQDVAYWVNAHAEERFGGSAVSALNCAVEESAVGDRDSDLLEQDKFVRDHITSKDVLVLSLGGNDIALKPTFGTIVAALGMTKSTDAMITSGWGLGTWHFMDLFHTRIQAILRTMTAVTRPAKIVVCMIYYPDETPSDSWADRALGGLGYDQDPAKLQLIIRTLFERITAKGFDVPGTVVETLPLFRVLDPKDSADYECRVEPSVQGGEKMARAFLDACYCPAASAEEAAAAMAAHAVAMAPPPKDEGTRTCKAKKVPKK